MEVKQLSFFFIISAVFVSSQGFLYGAGLQKEAQKEAHIDPVMPEDLIFYAIHHETYQRDFEASAVRYALQEIDLRQQVKQQECGNLLFHAAEKGEDHIVTVFVDAGVNVNIPHEKNGACVLSHLIEKIAERGKSSESTALHKDYIPTIKALCAAPSVIDFATYGKSIESSLNKLKAQENMKHHAKLVEKLIKEKRKQQNKAQSVTGLSVTIPKSEHKDIDDVKDENPKN